MSNQGPEHSSYLPDQAPENNPYLKKLQAAYSENSQDRLDKIWDNTSAFFQAVCKGQVSVEELGRLSLRNNRTGAVARAALEYIYSQQI